MKIATHNSATGEKSNGFLSCLVSPFAKCQNKTIKEQYISGCRMFDIRLKHSDNFWRCAHGLWTSKKPASLIFSEINDFEEKCYVMITYEGKLDANNKDSFLSYVSYIKSNYNNINYGPVCAKYADNNTTVDWITLEEAEHWEDNEQAFLPLDGKHWQTYFPFPKFWKFFYFRSVIFNNNKFKFVDFL